jgi:hypothetical protein
MALVVVIENSATMERYSKQLISELNKIDTKDAFVLYAQRVPKLALYSDLKLTYLNGSEKFDINYYIKLSKKLKRYHKELNIILLICSRPLELIHADLCSRVSVLCPFEYEEFATLGLKSCRFETCVLLQNEIDYPNKEQPQVSAFESVQSQLINAKSTLVMAQGFPSGNTLVNSPNMVQVILPVQVSDEPNQYF